MWFYFFSFDVFCMNNAKTQTCFYSKAEINSAIKKIFDLHSMIFLRYYKSEQIINDAHVQVLSSNKALMFTGSPVSLPHFSPLLSSSITFLYLSVVIFHLICAPSLAWATRLVIVGGAQFCDAWTSVDRLYGVAGRLILVVVMVEGVVWPPSPPLRSSSSHSLLGVGVESRRWAGGRCWGSQHIVFLSQSVWNLSHTCNEWWKKEWEGKKEGESTEKEQLEVLLGLSVTNEGSISPWEIWNLFYWCICFVILYSSNAFVHFKNVISFV